VEPAERSGVKHAVFLSEVDRRVGVHERRLLGMFVAGTSAIVARVFFFLARVTTADSAAATATATADSAAAAADAAADAAESLG
jgi:hypothetical protein